MPTKSSSETLLNILKETVDGGMSSKELAHVMGYNSPSSVSKLIYTINKKRGEDIILYDSNEKIYRYIGPDNYNATEKIDNKKPAEKSIYVQCGAKRVKKGTIKEILYSFLKSNTKEGVNIDEMSNISGQKRQNVFYVLNAFKKRHRLKIDRVNGKYFLRERTSKDPGTNNYKSYEKTKEKYQKTKDTVHKEYVTSRIEQLAKEVGDPNIRKGIKFIGPDEMEDFLSLLKRSLYYKNCALKLIEANELINNVREEITENEL